MRYILFCCALFLGCISYAQNVSINADGTAPDPSAMLDVADTTKGLLVPRMKFAQRNLINNPATGLLIFQIDSDSGFYFNQGTPAIPDWLKLVTSIETLTQVTDTDNDTKIQLEETSDDDVIRFDQAGTEFFRMDSGRFEIVNTGANIFIGQNAGLVDPLNNNGNVGIGRNVLQSNLTGESNVVIGTDAMQTMEGGFHNVAIGMGSLENSTSGGNNVAIGRSAGRNNIVGDSNIFVGFQAGRDETGSNKLYIENSSSVTPLIYGDFDTDSMVVNGVLTIDSLKDGSGYTLPGVDGNVAEVLHTNGAGTTYWGVPPGSLFSLVGQTVLANSTNYKLGIGTASIEPNFKMEIAVAGGGLTSGLLIDNPAGAGSNDKIGLQIELDASSARSKYGSRTFVIGTANSSDSLFGHYTEITPDKNTVSPPSFAYKAKFKGTDGDNWGVFMENEDQNYFSGNVGIGVEKPTALLELNNAINPRKIAIYTMADNDHQFLGFGTAFGELRYQVDQTTTDHVFYSGTSTSTSSELFRITGDGNVGMGTSTPVLNLVVTDSATSSVVGIHAANTSGDAYVAYISNGSAQFVSGYDQSSNTFKLAPNIANNSFTMSSLGNVGLGTDSPSELLHISTSNGDAQILLEADTDNNAEADNPRLLFAQDGGVVSGFVGFEGTAGTFSASTISNALMMTTTSAQPLQFGTNSNIQMTILDGGNVGIGTETPGRKLNVSGTEYVTTLLESSSVSGTWLAFNNTSAGGKFHHILTTGSSNGAGPGKMHFGYGNSDNAVLGIAMTLADRLVGIGEDSPIGPLHVKTFGTFDVPLILEGDAEIAFLDANDFEIVQVDATGAITNRRFKISSTGNVTIDGGATTVTSDSTFKVGVTPIPNALESILKLEGVYHYWDTLNTVKGRFQSTRTLGLIAQKLQRVYPELVVENEEGFLSVDYSKFSAVLLQAIKEQQKQIEMLQAGQSNAKLQRIENEKLRLRIEKLEKILIKD